jgi:hypothetical protein
LDALREEKPKDVIAQVVQVKAEGTCCKDQRVSHAAMLKTSD